MDSKRSYRRRRLDRYTLRCAFQRWKGLFAVSSRLGSFMVDSLSGKFPIMWSNCVPNQIWSPLCACLKRPSAWIWNRLLRPSKYSEWLVGGLPSGVKPSKSFTLTSTRPTQYLLSISVGFSSTLTQAVFARLAWLLCAPQGNQTCKSDLLDPTETRSLIWRSVDYGAEIVLPQMTLLVQFKAQKIDNTR